MRCPYCRQIMADTSERCARCGAVARDGRWVRGPGRGGASTADGMSAPTVDGTSAPTVDGTREPTERAGAREGPRGAPARPVPPPAGAVGHGRGCAVASVVLGIVLVLAFGGVLVAVVGRGSSGQEAPMTAPGSTWSSAGQSRFEAACRGGGTDADDCRCLRTELEQRFTEAQVDVMVAQLGRGSSLSPDVERRFREAERACGAGS